MWQKILALFLIAIGILMIILALAYTPFVRYQQLAVEHKIRSFISFEPQKTNILFVGDIMLARGVEQRLDEEGVHYPLSYIRDHLTAPFIVGNFEASVPKVHMPTPSMVMRFSVHPEHLALFKDSGITHLSLANNHAYDFGREGYIGSVSALSAEGVVPFGHPYELGTTSVAYIELHKKTVALIGLYAVVENPTKAELEELLAAASVQSDFQIAYIHWGNEYELTHSGAQERLAEMLIDVGVDAIVGHHPHVVQDIQLYKGAPVFYSLGNFIFDQYFSTHVQQGLMVEFGMRKNNSLTIHLYPVTSEASRNAPQMLTGEAKTKFLGSLADRSDPALKEGILNGIIEVPIP